MAGSWPAFAASTGMAARCSGCGRCGCSATASSPSRSSCTSTPSASMPWTIGIVLTLTLIGDIAHLALADDARRPVRAPPGARGGSLLMALAGVAFALTDWVPLLILAGRSGSSRRPATRSARSSPSSRPPSPRPCRTSAGRPRSPGTTSSATSRRPVGALAAGLLSRRSWRRDVPTVDAYRAVVIGYAVIGLVMARRLLAARRRHRGPAAGTDERRRPGGARPAPVARRGPPPVGALLPRRVRGRVHPAEPDGLLVPPPVRGRAGGPRGHLLRREPAGRGLVAVGRPDRARFGLINTMVFTHLPSNVLLILVPLMPTLPLAVTVLLLRFSLSQMDVPTRQSYVLSVVDADERSARRRDRHRPHGRRADLAVAVVGDDGERRARRRAVLPGRRPQDPVRPAAVPRLPVARRRPRSGPPRGGRGPTPGEPPAAA